MQSFYNVCFFFFLSKNTNIKCLNKPLVEIKTHLHKVVRGLCSAFYSVFVLTLRFLIFFIIIYVFALGKDLFFVYL